MGFVEACEPSWLISHTWNVDMKKIAEHGEDCTDKIAVNYIHKDLYQCSKMRKFLEDLNSERVLLFLA